MSDQDDLSIDLNTKPAIASIDRLETSLDQLQAEFNNLASKSDQTFKRWSGNTSKSFSYISTEAQAMADAVNRSFYKMKDGASIAVNIVNDTRKAVNQVYALSIADAARHGQDLTDLQIAQQKANGATLTAHHANRLRVIKEAAAVELEEQLSFITMEEGLDKLAYQNRLKNHTEAQAILNAAIKAGFDEEVKDRLAAVVMDEAIDKAAHDDRIKNHVESQAVLEAAIKAGFAEEVKDRLAAVVMDEAIDKAAHDDRIKNHVEAQAVLEAAIKAGFAEEVKDRLAAIAMDEAIDKAAHDERIKNHIEAQAILNAAIKAGFDEEIKDRLAAIAMDDAIDKAAYDNRIKNHVEAQAILNAAIKAGFDEEIKDRLAAVVMDDAIDKAAHDNRIKNHVEAQAFLEAAIKAGFAEELKDRLAALVMEEELVKLAANAKVAAEREAAAEVIAVWKMEEMEYKRIKLAEAAAAKLAAAEAVKASKLAAAAVGTSHMGLNSLVYRLTDVHSLMRGLSSGFNLLWLTWGSMAPLMAGAAVSMSYVASLKIGSKVAEDLSFIQNVAGATKDEMNLLGTAITDLGKTTAFGPVKVTETLKTLTMAGLNAKEALVALKPALEFSVVGGMEPQKAAESLVAVSTAFGYSAKGIGTVADYISKAAAISMADVEGMTESFKAASVVAQQYGVSLNDAALNLVFLNQVGVRGSAAGTAMKNMYTELISGSKKATVALKEMGIEALDKTTNTARPFIEVIGQLDVALRKKTATAQQSLLADMANNRGAKDVVAALQAYRTSVRVLSSEEQKHIDDLKASGQAEKARAEEVQLATTQYKLLQKQLEESAGFTTFAALEHSLNPKQQFDSIKAALSTALNDSFKSMGDGLYILGERIKGIFNDPGFTKGLSTVAEGVNYLVTKIIDLSQWIASHKDGIVTITAALIAAGVAYAAVNVAVGVATVVQIAYTASIGFLAASAIGAELGIVSLTASVTGLTVAMLKNPITWALVAAGIAAAYVWTKLQTAETDKLARATKEHTEAERLRAANYNTNIDSAIKSEEALLRSMQNKTSFQNEMAKLEAEEARNRIYNLSQEAVAVARLTHLEAIQARNKLEAMGATGDSILLKNANKTIDDAAAAIGTALLNGAKEIEQLEAKQGKLKLLKDATKKLADEEAARNRNKPVGDEERDPRVSKKEDAARLKYPNTELALIKRNLAEQESVLKHGYSTQQALLDDLNKSKMISSGEYAASELGNMIKYDREATELRQSTIDNARRVFDAGIKTAQELLKGTDLKNEVLKLTGLYTSIVTGAINAGVAQDENAVLRMAKTANSISAHANKLGDELDKFWKEDTISAIESLDKLNYGLDEYGKVKAEAAATATAKYAKELNKLDTEIQTVGASLAFALQNTDVASSEEGKAYIAQLARAMKRLNDLKDQFIDKAAAGTVSAITNAASRLDRQKLAKFADSIAGAIEVAFDQGGQAGMSALRKAIMDEFIREPIKVMIKAFVGDIVNGISSGSETSTGVSAITGIVALDTVFSKASKLAGAFNGSGLGGIAQSSLGASLGLSTADTMAFNGTGAMAQTYTNTTAGQLFSSLPIGGMMVAYTKGGAAGFAQGVASTAIAGAVTGGIAGAAAGTGVTAGALGGASTALTSIGPWGWAALGVMAILGGNKGTPVKSLGESTLAYDALGTITSRTDRYADVDNSNSQATANGVANTYYQAAQSLGIITKEMAVGVGFMDNGLYRMAADIGGKQVFDTGETKTGEAEVKDAAAQAVLSALKASELPKYLEGIFDNINIRATSAAQAEDILKVAAAYKAIHDAVEKLPLNALTGASYEVITNLAAMSGGLGKLSTNLAYYFENFYSTSELLMNSTNSLSDQFKALGFTMPTTKDAFRGLVDAVGVATPEAQALTAALYGLAPALVATTDAAASKYVAKLNAQIKIYDALGEREKALAITRYNEFQAMDDALKPAQLYIYALQDTVTIREALISTYEKESAALQSTVDGLKSSVKTLEDLQGSLKYGSNSTLTNQEKYLGLKADMTAAGNAAAGMGGVTDAQQSEAIANLPSLTQQFLEVSKTLFASGGQYTTDYETVTALVDTALKSSSGKLDVAQSQLDVLKQSYDHLGLIAASSKTTADFITQYLGSLGKSNEDLVYAQSKGYKSNLPNTSSEIEMLYKTLAGRTGSSTEVADWVSRAGTMQIDTLVKTFAKEVVANNDGPTQLAKDINSGVVRTVPLAESIAPTNDAKLNDMVTELKALNAELTQLRNDQKKQTGDIIVTNYDANIKASDKIVEKQVELEADSYWKNRIGFVMDGA